MPIGTLRGMTDIHAIISEIDEYCFKAKVSASTVCNRARNNARLYDRLKRKAGKLDEDIAALRKWMRDNPPVERREHAP